MFKELDNGQRCSPHAIKRAITQDGERSDSPLARFVGLQGLREGRRPSVCGHVRRVEYLPDRTVLTSLADEKLMRVAVGLRNDEGWVNIDLSIAPNHDRYRLHRIEPSRSVSRLNCWRSSNACKASWRPWRMPTTIGMTREEAYNAIDARLDAIAAEIDGYRQFSDEDKARSVCFVNVGRDGKAEIHRAMSRPRRRPRPRSSSDRRPGIRRQGCRKPWSMIWGTHRQQIAKAKLARDPKLAMDVLLCTDGFAAVDVGLCPRPIEASFSSVPDLAGGSEHAETPCGCGAAGDPRRTLDRLAGH